MSCRKVNPYTCSTNRYFDKIVGAGLGRGFEGEDPIQDFATALQAAETQALGDGQHFFSVKAFPVVFSETQQVTIFFAKTDLQVFSLRMFDRIMHDLLQHPENVDLFIFGYLDLFYDVQLNIDGLLVVDLVNEFPDSLQQPLPLQRTRQKIVRNTPHAADDLIQVARRLIQDDPVRRNTDVYAADVQLHRR